MDDGNKATHVVYIYCADTLQYSFASHLSRELRRKGISAFVNCNETLEVIKAASAVVVVISKNYLSSTSCLDKLVRVLQCRRKNSQLVFPVLYGVSPLDVVVPEHESADRIREWSSALQELRESSGHQSREENSEWELVEEIVKDVYEKLSPAKNIGINSRLLEIELLLCKQTWGIRRIGIWGMPGIGKTTLAQAFFDQISGHYEASCFIKHFHKAFHEKGLHRLLEEHFGKILMELPGVRSSITRPSLPRDKLNKKRTLVVLDDVHNPLVVEAFLGGFHWFGPGSLIIITSRDKQVFRLCQINHVYEVQSLKENEALQLFSHCAFGKDRQQNLLELSMEVIDYANGNPLALSFYGGELKGKELSEMAKTFRELKERTPYKIHDIFKSSYETLNDSQKNIFLDIACFFNGENVDYVKPLLEGCGFFPHVGIDVLVEKCLVTISENRVQMHRLIQNFGQEIVNGEMVQIERGRRLWEPCTIKFILEDDELEANRDPKATYTRTLGTEDIEGIFLDMSNLIFDVKPGAFENMFNLRFLKIYCSTYEKHYGLGLPKGLESLPYKLRLLHWENYPLQSLPQDFNPCHLVELNMPYSQLQKLWTGTKNLEMLKTVKLCHSEQLTEIDDICKAQNIELIDLQGCTKLQSFPATGQLQHLRVVNLSGCIEIRSFPEVSSNIEELHLQGTGISELPISIVSLFKQVKLNREHPSLLTELSGVSNALNNERLTSLAKVFSSNQHLDKMVLLNMKDCSHLRSLPHMVDLESLRVLHLSGCSQLKDIQGLPRNLKELYLAGIAVEELPQLPQSLEVLNAHGCLLLKSIPFGFEQLPRYYTFSDCFALSAQVVSEFVVNALANVERMAREYQQEQELNKSLAFSFTVPLPANKSFTLDLQPGSSVMIRLDPSWRSTLVGFAILVEVAFSEDYPDASDFGISYLCRWKDKEGVSHRLENTLPCWTPGEGVPKFQEDHLFVFCDLNLHPSSGAGKDPDILADLVVFEFFPVNKEKKLLDGICTVKKCGVYVITDAKGDTNLNMTQLLSPMDCSKEVSDRTKMNNDALENINETSSKDSGELVGKEDHVVDMSALSRSKSKEVKKVVISGFSGKGSLASSTMAGEIETKEDLENLGGGLELGKRKVKTMMFDAEGGGIFGISGMGGVGKTTLARELERDDEVRCYFKNQILFLTVSQSPILDELRAHIWGFLFDYEGLNPVPNWNFQFEGGIKTRKLVILDDVWTISAVDRLAYQFPGCTTLVVSRSKFTGPETTYDVEVLREDEAFSLFCLCAFGQKSVPPGFSKDLVKQVADECKGLPLAIKVTVASLKDRPEKYWEGALQRLSRGEPADDTHETRLLHQMEASLENLDPTTRECFLDLGAFPEDSNIPVDVLINMWTEVHDLSEGNAFAILVDLADKNLLTLAKDSRIVTQHDVLRDLALYLSNRVKVNRRQRLLMPKRELVLPREWEKNSDEPYNAQIVSIHTGEMNESEWFDMEFPKAEVLILNFSSDKYVLPPFISKMSRLRVLVIINNGMSPAVLHGFSTFANLSKLRSLWLESVHVPELSNATVPLKNLHKMSLILCKINNSFGQTGVDLADIFPNLSDLTIDYCDDLVALSTSICGMTSLNSLSITNCSRLGSLPKKLSKLQALEIIRLYACPELNALPGEICELTRLKYLDITQCISLDCLPEDIGNLTILEKIDMSECYFSGIPSSAVSLVSLRVVICDEDVAFMWEEVKKTVPGLRIEAVEQQCVSLDWRDE